MQIDIAFFDALKQANVPEAAARAAAESLSHEIDRRYELHVKQLPNQTEFARMQADIKAEFASLRTDIANVRADLSKQIAEQQRWTITVMFASIVALGAIQKLWS
jgi:Tfp pilus assembly protein PilO